MKELTDLTKSNSKGVGRGAIERWRHLLLLPFLLLAFGCGGGGGGSDGADNGQTNNGSEPAGAAMPADLVGQWNTTLTYIPAYYTGVVPTSDFIGSLGITVYFQSSGAYEFDLSTASTYFNGNCFRSTQWSEVGKASVAGAALTFTSTHATNMVMDSCGAAQFVDPAPTGTATYTITREQDQTGWPLLRLHTQSGDDVVLEKCRNCG